MIFVTLYACGLWVIAWRYRRRWVAFAAIAAGTPPIFGAARLDIWIVDSLFGEDVSWVYMVAIVFAFVFVFIGLLLAIQPRAHPSHACQNCGYDLRGLAASCCPECGLGGSETKPTPRTAPKAPDQSRATQLADSRRDRNLDSTALSVVTKTAPPSAQPPTTSQ